METISDIINKTGLDDTTLAYKCGISVSTLRVIKNGNRPVSSRTINRVLRFLSQELGKEYNTSNVSGLNIS
jgi:DNA-binding Xre family transcriptional regulator